MGRRNLTFARQRACDGREAPKIARHFPTAALSFEFSHSLQDLCTRIRALIQKGFLSAKVRCKKIRLPAEDPVMVPTAHRTINRRDSTNLKPRDV
jgi:hypothetical protein